jgi:hypothetical protein
VDVIKDFVQVDTTEPGRERVEFTWTDAAKWPRGRSRYSVRVLPNDGELAWASPVRVNLSGASAAGE